VRKIVAVIGPGVVSGQLARQAEAVGYELGRRGIIVICGGLGGVMAAACRGAKKAGGITIGVLPDANTKSANRWVDVAIATGLGEARNLIIICSADAAIAIGGEFGTLSEIGFTLKLKKPVIGLGTWKITPPKKLSRGIILADSPGQAVDHAVAQMNRAGAGRALKTR
jgi:uncharacterized protein (TIGR00725 family)